MLTSLILAVFCVLSNLTFMHSWIDQRRILPRFNSYGRSRLFLLKPTFFSFDVNVFMYHFLTAALAHIAIMHSDLFGTLIPEVPGIRLCLYLAFASPNCPPRFTRVVLHCCFAHYRLSVRIVLEHLLLLRPEDSFPATILTMLCFNLSLSLPFFLPM